jgi:hypothetical protein
MKNMNHPDTSNEETVVNTRPLFSSAWLALFSVLRQRYNGEVVVAPARSERPRAMRKKHPGYHLNSFKSVSG